MLKTSQYFLTAIASAALVLIVPTSAQALCAAASDLNGVWNANDQGTYYVRQIGNDVWWVGMSNDGGKTWTNVFKGVRNGTTVTGQWADVPRGRIRSGGVLNLSIQGNAQSVSGFSRTAVSGGFGGSRWFQNCDDTRLIPAP